MAECCTNQCLKEITNTIEQFDREAFAQHECNYHPEIKKEACDRFYEFRNGIEKREKELLKACACEKVQKVI
jgi:hypothetical protein